MVAGVAVADDPHVASFAPAAELMPVEVPSLAVTVDDPTLAEGLRWAADHGADVICCAWAPTRPTTESRVFRATIRDALDHCLTRGRNGRGCIVVAAAGNHGADLALNGYASHPGVVAVGACNRTGTRVAYSGWGDALWCVFPSNDPHDPVGTTMTYTTTAPVGSLLDGEAFYTTRFGFTSAACAAVAGISACIVSANPALTAEEVRGVLSEACDRIDPDGGSYDPRGHSPFYGYGRPDAARAVAIARARPAFLGSSR